MTIERAKNVLLHHKEWLLSPPTVEGGWCEEIAEAIDAVLKELEERNAK